MSLEKGDMIRAIQDCGIPAKKKLKFKQCQQLVPKLMSFLKIANDRHRYLISIDIGNANFAWCVYDRINSVVIDLNMFDLQITEYHPQVMATAVKHIVGKITTTLPKHQCLFIVE